MPRESQVRDIKLSKVLSWILRHGATREGIAISDDGYINLNIILNHASFSKYTISDILRVVETNDKQRFSLRKHPVTDELEIKANQGHSIKVPDIDLRPLEYNDSTVVVHGTYLRNWELIKEKGLNRMTRNHIHFACGEPGNANVISGIRHNCEVYIYLNARKLLEDGIPLYMSPNQVILCPGNDEGIIHPKYFEEVKFVEPNISDRRKQKVYRNKKISYKQ